MLRKLFWVLLAFSFILYFFFRKQINNSINYRLHPENISAFPLVNIDIKDLTLASSTSITIAERAWLDTFIKRLEKTNLNKNNTVKNIKVSSVFYDKYHDAYLKLESGEIRVNTNSNLETVWNDYVSAVEDKDLKNKISTDMDNLEYLDLRFVNKLFYRFKDTLKKSTTTVEMINNNIKNVKNSKGILGTSTIASSSRQ